MLIAGIKIVQKYYLREKMPEPTLQQVFGPNASQDEQTVTISKSDLSLLAQAENTAESILVSIIKVAMDYLNENTTNPDIQVFLEEGFESLIFVGEEQFRQKQININLRQPEQITPINPMDY